MNMGVKQLLNFNIGFAIGTVIVSVVLMVLRYDSRFSLGIVAGVIGMILFNMCLYLNGYYDQKKMEGEYAD